MREKSVLGVDLLLIAATLALVSIGVLFIYSSGVTSSGDSFSTEWIRQIIWASMGIGMFIGITLIDYNRLRDWTPYIYGAAILSLIGTLLFGRVVNGARSWIGIGELGVQPSEFAKIATILFLATYFDRQKNRVQSPAPFLGALAIVSVPMILVLLQPDYGTALVYLPIFLVMAFVAGARPSYIVFIVLTGALLIIFRVLPAWREVSGGPESVVGSVVTDRRLLIYVLTAVLIVALIGLVGVYVFKKRAFRWVTYAGAVLAASLIGSVVARRLVTDFRLMRLIVFLDPNVDPRGAGWNIIQSVTAVGSGGITGKGWLEGTQSHLQYLPQQSTDFIFSILAEEWGFVGAAAVLSAYLVILIRGLLISTKAKDNFAVYVAIGVVAMIFFHVAVNVGMAMGIMPITGIPLFFLSYGGSSLWTALISVGLLMSIFQHRYRY